MPKKDFLQNTKVNLGTGCLIWQKCLDKDGYGQVRFQGKWRQAHRVSWVLYHKKEIPKGLCILHKCDNPACVNPEHLFLGTQKDNMKDMHQKGRAADHGRELSGNAKLTQKEVREIRKLKGIKSGIEIAKIYNISQSHVCNLCANRSWKN